jgi:glucokinase
MPGYMGRDRTRLLFTANLPTLSGSDFLINIKKAFDLPIIFDADCNASAWGEHRFGAGRGVDRLIVTTVGTGIGAGVVIDGKIVRTFHQVAGSLGHVVIDAKGPKCKCGGQGCLETKASGPTLEKLATDLARRQPSSKLASLLADNNQLTGKEIGLALQHNDSTAIQAVTECGWWLGAGIASWSVIYNPQKILIGGGLAKLGEPWLSAIRTGFKEVAQPRFHKTTTIEPAALAQDTGIIGAADLAYQNPTR